jgi:hypothetical protein
VSYSADKKFSHVKGDCYLIGDDLIYIHSIDTGTLRKCGHRIVRDCAVHYSRICAVADRPRVHAALNRIDALQHGRTDDDTAVMLAVANRKLSDMVRLLTYYRDDLPEPVRNAVDGLSQVA